MDTNETVTVSLPHADGWSDLDSHSMKSLATLLSSYEQVSEMLVNTSSVSNFLKSFQNFSNCYMQTDIDRHES